MEDNADRIREQELQLYDYQAGQNSNMAEGEGGEMDPMRFEPDPTDELDSDME